MANYAKMNILVTLDQNYILPLRVMLHSILTADPQTHIMLYVAHSSLTDADFARIREGVPEGQCTLCPVYVPPELLCDAPVLRRLTKASYYRLIAPAYLPQEVDRILYLDPDITVIRSLRELYETDLEGNYIAAAGHFDGWFLAMNLKRLGIRYNRDYVNSGVLLMDVEKLRALNNTQQIFDYVRDHARKLLLGDQDMVNIFYDGKIKILDTRKYNLDEKTFLRRKKRGEIDEAWVRDNGVLIHYDGSKKPWHSGYKGALSGYFMQARADLEKKVGGSL